MLATAIGHSRVVVSNFKPRRIEKRLAGSWSVTCQLESGKQRGECLNLSKGGARLRMDSPPAVGKFFPISIVLPECGEIIALAEARWGQAGGEEIGVRFLSVEAISLGQLDHFLTKPITHEAHTTMPVQRVWSRVWAWLSRRQH